MAVESELLEFASTRPAWQQDLIRRICTQPEVSAEDIEQVLANLKAAVGIGTKQALIPLGTEHLRKPASAQQDPVILAGISNVENANRLAGGQYMPFALNGITLIYGHNGSGKTGYARILKQVCRARRDKYEPMRGNVYEAASGAARAKISYVIGKAPREFNWEEGKQGVVDLSRISVFDAATEPLYADRQNEIEFLPFGLDVLPALGAACERFQERLRDEIDALTRSCSVPLPTQIAGTAADVLTRRLIITIPESGLPSEDEIRRLATWSQSDAERLRAIEDELQRLSQPARAAAQCRRFKTSIDALLTRLKTSVDLLSEMMFLKYREQFERAHAARQAAVVAAQGRFDQDPLGKAVSSEAWRRLYQYAEEFNKVAYPGEEFPATAKGRVCLLCQQRLGEEAGDRMQRFRAFVKDNSQKEAEREELNLRDMVRQLGNAAVPTASDVDLQFLDLSATEPTFEIVRSKLGHFVDEAKSCRDRAIECLKGAIPFDNLGALDRSSMGAAIEFSATLERRANVFDQAVVGTDQTDRLKAEHTELLGRQRLNTCVEIAKSRRYDLVKLHRLRQCKDQCDTTQISRKNTEFRRKYLTADFAARIKDEIKFLNLDYLPLKVEDKTEKGTSYIGVGLNSISTARNSNILSEGEFRALALACFLAEIATIPNHSGIVIDDPVSSLDHRHIKKVAVRLVKEAANRPQVIIFTHDLSFYYELWTAAAELRVPIQPHWVQHISGKGFGVVSKDEGPWQVKTTKERIDVMNKLLQMMPDPDTVPHEKYAAHVEEFYSALRETWERLVEECLLNSVVGRFQPGVATQSLKGVSVTDEDHREVFFAMKKASEFSGHDWAKGREGSLPDKTSMARDLAVMDAYRKELKKRAENLASKRRELENPPKAQTLPQN